MTIDNVSFRASDGVEIVGTHVGPDRAKGAALLLHMMPATKESWSGFAAALAELGVSSLAIDLRGHGASTRRGDETLDYKAFDDAAHQATRLDVEAAAEWLLRAHDRLALAGASIGANLAIRHAAAHPDARGCLALSPGLMYRGVATDDVTVAPERLFLAASSEDAYAFESARALAAAAPGARLRELAGAGHGTAMFEADPAFMREAAGWLASRLDV